MKLKSLRVFGFKTFAEQTTLAFEPGITALVGPNGSGKSNLVDAIRWVLGEQSTKSLRSARIEDVIFAGNERRKPLGMAEVSLTFDNHDRAIKLDVPEVQVTRRTYRAGESEFFINRTACRLRDVVELLMGTGLGPGSYAIVSQGQIDAILSSKPAERRSLFEETAGINRFLARKAESLRRLEQTEQNAIRVSDLLEEIGKRIPELETQARRARRFRKTSARLRDLEIVTYLRAGATRRDERAAVQTQLERDDLARTGALARTAALEADLTTMRTQALAAETALDGLRAQATAAQARTAELESLRAADLARRDAHEAQSALVTSDGERAEAERVELRDAIVRFDAEAAPLETALAQHRGKELEAREAMAAARAALDAVFARLRAAEAARSARASSEAERRAQLAAALAAHERLEAEGDALREEATRRSEALAAIVARAEAAGVAAALHGEELAAAAAAAGAAQTRVAGAGEALAEAQARLRTVTSELAGAEARLHTIEELEANLEGHVPGTRAVIEAAGRGELAGIHGVIANLIRVEERYARALDIAFGGGLSNIVTERSEDAERAIRYLSARELGRATFLPLDTLGQRRGRDGGEPRREGVIGYAHALVQTEPQYAGIVAYLVGRVLVVESLDVGVALVRSADFRDAIVTLEGDEIRGGGAMTGGKYRRERSILSRRAQARTLAASLPRQRAALAEAEAALRAAVDEAAAARQTHDAAGRTASEAALAVRGARAACDSLESERVRLAAEIETLLVRAGRVEAETTGARERIAVLDAVAASPFDDAEADGRLEAELGEARETIAHAQTAEREVTAEIAGAREALATLIARRDAAAARLALLDANRERAAAARERLQGERADLLERLERGATELATAHRARVDVEAAVERARAAREALVATQAGHEGDLRAARALERDAASAGETGRVRLAEIDAELGMLTAQFAQNPATAEECAELETRYAGEPGDFTEEIGRLREETGRLANVNLNAEAEIAELAERERFLREQLDDLARARETLLASVAQIEAGSQAQFNETFAKVKAAFEAVYVRLFPGGEARMWQTAPQTLSETGIEIAIQPPGKKLMALAALSGGERAMAAAALIFALIAVKPSPFYLLDEVDAALDDANVERFSALVREFAEHAQLLIVTHNKKTMELAQRMVGVTMAEPGISSVIAADLRASEPAATNGSLEPAASDAREADAVLVP